MKHLLFIFSLLSFLLFGCDSNTQNKQETTTSILAKYEDDVKNRLNDNLHKAGFSDFPTKLLIIGFKQEQRLEI